MNLDEWANLERQRLRDFVGMWHEKRRSPDAENWPDEMPEDKWDEQFIALSYPDFVQ